MQANTIPSTTFRSVDQAPRDQFDAWRERISVIFNVEPLDSTGTDGFRAEANAFHLGDLVLVTTRFDGQRFLRTPQQMRSDMLDHYLVQFYRHGGYVGDVDGNTLEINPGTVSILDLARPLETYATTADVVTVVVPRDVMEEALPRADGLHGALLDDGSAGLLADYLASLEQRLPSLLLSQAPHIVRATCDLIAACLRPSLDNLERAREQIEPLRLRQIRRYIDEHLECDDISPDSICWALQISRTQLYGLFKSQGGVQKYIQARRLLHIHAALADPRQSAPIAEIAQRFGFTSHAHLTRAFRQHFGYTPSELRHDLAAMLRRRVAETGGIAVAGSVAGEAMAGDAPGFDDWVRSLRA